MGPAEATRWSNAYPDDGAIREARDQIRSVALSGRRKRPAFGVVRAAPPLCYPDRMRGVARTGQSGAGRWSFWLSLLGGGAFSCALASLSLADRWGAAGGESLDASGLATVFALGILGSLLVTVVALVLGVVGMMQRRRRRLFALLGTAISVAVLLVASYGFLWDLL